MHKLFEETKIKSLTLKNRFVRSATWEGMCGPDGRPAEKLINCYRDLAKGGVGLIISGYTFVRPDGIQMSGTMGMHKDDLRPEMEALAKAVHDAGGKICVQLVHAGGQTNTKHAGRQPLAPSAIQVAQFPEIPQEMSKKDITEIVAAFADAARRARDFGFDAVQLHSAHGYLINQFLSQHTNKRNDEYGGSIENRCRFLMEVYNKVREEVGNDYPVLIKLNGSDNLDGGLNIEDAVYAAKILDSEGIDAIEVSSGTSASGEKNPVRIKISKPEKEAYNLDLAKKIKSTVSCPVIAVGGFRSFDVADRAIQYGIDYISMSRPFIREPNLISRWESGDTSKARCISCNSCFMPGIKEGGIYCVVEAREMEKRK